MFYDLIPGKQAYLENVVNLQIGNYFLHEEQPWKILNFQAKMSRHGSRICVEAENAFSKKILQKIYSIHSQLEIPLFQFEEYNLIGIQNDDFLSLLNSKGTVREDMKMPQFQELANKIKKWIEDEKTIIVQIMKYLDKEEVFDAKYED